MKIMRLLTVTFLMLVILSGCVPTIHLTQDTPKSQGAQPGYYLVSSVGDHGDVTFFGQLDPQNGYMRLEADGSGKMMYHDVEHALTWDESKIYWGEQTLPYLYTGYQDPELGQDDGFITVYFPEEGISVAFRSVTEDSQV